MTIVEPLAAGVVGMALLWLVAQPMIFPAAAAAEIPDVPDPEETPRGQALLALKEIEFDHATGKLSDADFASLNTRYSAAAIETLDAPVAIPAAAPTGSGAHCLVHGACTAAEARFCPDCGLGLVTDAGTCVACSASVSADSIFCAGCGVRVRA